MRSITYKLTLAFLLVGLCGAVLVAVIVRQRTRSAFDQFIKNQVQQALVATLVQYYEKQGSWEGVGDTLGLMPGIPPRMLGGGREIREDWMRFAVVGAERTVVFSFLPEHIGQGVSKGDLKGAISLELDGETIGWLLPLAPPGAWTPDSAEMRFLQNVNRAVLLSGLIAAVLAVILGGLLAFTMTRTLREMTEATEEIAKGKLGKQVKVRSQDELGELAESFNKMSLDLERATLARRQMTADIAHELRSPLSVISGYAEALSEGKLDGTAENYDILYQETKHLSWLVDDLRTLSLADAGELPLTKQDIQPQTLLERVAARYSVAAQQKEVLLRVEAEQSLPMIVVDVERMGQVLDNLVLNAFRYVSQGGKIILSARAAQGGVQLQVRDNGSGIREEDLPFIFNRLYRGDKARPQNGESGLGLAIVKSIVEAHGGIISVESIPGHGANFTILLVR